MSQNSSKSSILPSLPFVCLLLSKNHFIGREGIDTCSIDVTAPESSCGDGEEFIKDLVK